MELLVTIIVLGLILAITMPIVNKMINNSKENVYLETVRNIEEAAHMYVINNMKDFPETVGAYKFITIGQLQDEGLLVNTLIDPRTDLPINNGDVMVMMQSNGEYSYTFKNSNYVEEGLKLLLDGYRHGTVNTTWEDLSGNGYNGTLTNFTFTGGNGWGENYLAFTTSSDLLTTNNPLASQTQADQAYTVFITYEQSAYAYQRGFRGIGNLYLSDNQKSKLYFAFGTGFDTYVTTIAPLPLNQKQQLTFKFYRNSTTSQMRGRIYYNGEDYTYFDFPDDRSGLAGVMSATFYTLDMTGVKLYSVKVYNRILTDDEIEQNYLTDKERFNF